MQRYLAVKASIAGSVMDLAARPSSYRYMKSRRPNRIAEIRKAQGLSQAQLAEKVEAHWVTISRLERGELQLNEEWLDRLSRALSCSRSSIINWDAPSPVVYLSGEISGGYNIEFFEKQQELKLPFQPDDDIVTSWFRVADDAGWPFIKEGDLLRFFAVNESEVDNYISKLCMVFDLRSASGKLGFLEQSSYIDAYNLRPFSGRTIEKLEISRLRICAEIRFGMPWAKHVP